MTQDFYSVFNLSPSFDLDLAALEKRYFELQRQFHPDRMLGKLPAERQRALQASMTANQAYEALKSPLQRAQHLLGLKNIHVGGEQDSVKPSQALLVEIMELREVLSETSTKLAFDILTQRTEQDISKTQHSLSKAFVGPDLPRAAELTIRLGYLEKLAQEIRLKKKALS